MVKCGTRTTGRVSGRVATKGIKQVFKAIDLDLVHFSQLSSQPSGGEAFTGHPHHIGFGQVNQADSGIFAVGHTGFVEINQCLRGRFHARCDS